MWFSVQGRQKTDIVAQQSREIKVSFVNCWCSSAKGHLFWSVHQAQANLFPNPLTEIPRDNITANALVPCDLLKLTPKERAEMRSVVWWAVVSLVHCIYKLGSPDPQRRGSLPLLFPADNASSSSQWGFLSASLPFFFFSFFAKVGDSLISTPIFCGAPPPAHRKYANIMSPA